MTTEQFRKNASFTTHLRSLLGDSIMQEALMALHDSNLPSEPSDTADAIASVRRHSRSVGFNQCIADLLLLAEPLPVADAEEEQATYGVENV